MSCWRGFQKKFSKVHKKFCSLVAAPWARVAHPSFLPRTLVFSLLFAGAGARCSPLVLEGARQAQALREKLKRFGQFCQNVHALVRGRELSLCLAKERSRPPPSGTSCCGACLIAFVCLGGVYDSTLVLTQLWGPCVNTW